MLTTLVFVLLQLTYKCSIISFWVDNVNVLVMLGWPCKFFCDSGLVMEMFSVMLGCNVNVPVILGWQSKVPVILAGLDVPIILAGTIVHCQVELNR